MVAAPARQTFADSSNEPLGVIVLHLGFTVGNHWRPKIIICALHHLSEPFLHQDHACVLRFAF